LTSPATMTTPRRADGNVAADVRAGR